MDRQGQPTRGEGPFALDEDERRELDEHFRRRRVPWTEEALLGVLESARSPTDVHMAVIALRGCGTARSLSALERLFHHKKPDVRQTAILTHAHIAGRTGTPHYAAALLDPTYRDKGYAMTAIDAVADGRAVDAVLAHFHAKKARIRRGELWDGTFCEGVRYLGRHLADDARIEAFFGDVRRCWDRLSVADRATLANEVAYFRDRKASPIR